MALSDARSSRRTRHQLRRRDVGGATTARDGPPPITRPTVPTCRAHYPGGPDGCSGRLLPRPRGLPRYSGGSASATSLSRPAQASLTLRPAGSLNRPKRPLSRGFGPASCPTKPLVSYQALPTTARVDPSSTGEPRLRGARRVEDGRGGWGLAASLRLPSPLIKPDVRVSRIRLSDWFHREAHGGAPR